MQKGHIMKIAEALIQRADAQKRLQQLRQRLARSAQAPEGEQPPENPQDLLAQVDEIITSLTSLIKAINQTNSVTQFDEERTLTDVLAERDMLMLKRSILTGLIDSATQTQSRYDYRLTITDTKQARTVDVRALQAQVDAISQEYRQLDTAIQQMNWTIDLIE